MLNIGLKSLQVSHEGSLDLVNSMHNVEAIVRELTQNSIWWDTLSYPIVWFLPFFFFFLKVDSRLLCLINTMNEDCKLKRKEPFS